MVTVLMPKYCARTHTHHTHTHTHTDYTTIHSIIFPTRGLISFPFPCWQDWTCLWRTHWFSRWTDWLPLPSMYIHTPIPQYMKAFVLSPSLPFWCVLALGLIEISMTSGSFWQIKATKIIAVPWLKLYINKIKPTCSCSQHEDLRCHCFRSDPSSSPAAGCTKQGK